LRLGQRPDARLIERKLRNVALEASPPEKAPAVRESAVYGLSRDGARSFFRGFLASDRFLFFDFASAGKVRRENRTRFWIHSHLAI